MPADLKRLYPAATANEIGAVFFCAVFRIGLWPGIIGHTDMG